MSQFTRVAMSRNVSETRFNARYDSEIALLGECDRLSKGVELQRAI